MYFDAWHDTSIISIPVNLLHYHALMSVAKCIYVLEETMHGYLCMHSFQLLTQIVVVCHSYITQKTLLIGLGFAYFPHGL